MESSSGGYTLIEVMIVLGITALLFFSATQVFSSQNRSTNFSQSIQDVSSKIQSYANQVATSTYPGSSNYSCTVAPITFRATLSTLSPGSGTTCLFLGLALQAPATQNSIEAYTILGNKELYAGAPISCGGFGATAQKIDCTNPEPALLSGSPNNYQLTDTYTLGTNITILSSKVVDSSGSQHLDYGLVGMYNGLPGDSAAASSGNNALVLRGYGCGVGCGFNSNTVRTCIEETACTSPVVKPITQWILCFKDAATGKTALLTIGGAPGGITSNINFPATACT